MKIFTYCLIIFLFSFNYLLANNCDSLVITVKKEQTNYGGWTLKNVNTLTYRNNLLYRDGNYTYFYDSLQRIAEIVRDDSFKVVHLYNSIGKDSVLLSMSYNGNSYYVAQGHFIIYDINGNPSIEYYENYDTLTMQWDTLNYVRHHYSNDSINHNWTHYYYPDSSKQKDQWTVIDSLGRLKEEGYHYSFYMVSSYYYFDSICTDNIISSHFINNVAGPMGSQSSGVSIWKYDSLCRPINKYDRENSYYSQNNHYYTETLTDYYYADCNNIVIAGLDTVVTCMNGVVNLDLYAYGGTGPYSFAWAQADSLSLYNILNPMVFTDTGNVFHLTVTDSIGNSSHFETVVAINFFTTAVTDATCDTCRNGEVSLSFSGIHSDFNLIVTPDSGTWNGNILSGIKKGDYLICSKHVSCNYCDSVHIVSPILVEEEVEENVAGVYPNPARKNIFIYMKNNLNSSIFEWRLIDLQGKIIKQGKELQNEFIIPVDLVSRGLYFLEILSGNRNIIKVVIN